MAVEDMEKYRFDKRTPEEQVEIAKQGGIASGESRRQRKTLKEELLLLLAEGDTQQKVSLALIQKAMNGDTKAFEVIRDSIGEKQADKVDLNGTMTYEKAIQEVVDEDEY